MTHFEGAAGTGNIVSDARQQRAHCLFHSWWDLSTRNDAATAEWDLPPKCSNLENYLTQTCPEVYLLGDYSRSCQADNQ